MGRSFEDVEVGEAFSHSVTITETHVVLAAGLFGDFAPLHVDAEFASKSRFGQRLAHGTLVVGIAASGLVKHFGEYAAGYLEQNLRFVAPVYIGDTVASRWQVVEKAPKEKLGGGIVEVALQCTTQRGDLAIEGASKLIIANAGANATG